MQTRKYTFFVTLLLFCLILSACSTGPRTETIIMSSGDEVSGSGQGSQPFQVKKIYRIPDHLLKTGRLLGWASSNRIVAAPATKNTIGQNALTYLSAPYEKGQPISNVDYTGSQMGLSPNGKYLFENSSTINRLQLTVTSLKDGSQKTITNTAIQNNEFMQSISWSNDSESLIYMINYPNMNQVSSVYIYNLSTQKSTKYEVNDVDQEDTLLDAQVSDDQHSVLLNVMRSRQANKVYTILATINGDKLSSQYERQSSTNQSVWLNNDQFVFLGSDGTLYEYDQRNGELAIILEQVTNFSFSLDRKYIAYAVYDQNVIYAGKVQGKNIVYNEPVYHGIIAARMDWSQDNTSLLLQGSKQLYNTQFAAGDVDEEVYVIELD